jgi:outer membrane protein assembly factor BamA
MAGVELVLHYHPHDYIGHAASGPAATIGGGYHGQIGGESYGFWRLHAEVALYLHLFHGRMLVMRTAGQMIDPPEDRSVPFYMQSEIGRRETVRGFSRGRFRDLDMVAASIEYHYPIWIHRDDRLNAFLFTDAGQVAHDLKTDLDRDDLRFGFGGGIVFRSTEEELFRFTVAKSEERWRMYFVYNQ